MFLLVDGKLNGREGEIAEDGGFVAIKESGNSFLTDNGSGGIKGRAVIVAGLEERVVVATLELKTGFENFGGDVNKGCGKISEKT